MAITFQPLNIRGTHGPVVYEPPGHQSKIVKYWGLHGERELTGGRGGRMLRCHITLHAKHLTRKALEAAVSLLNRNVGAHGTLEVRLADGTSDRFADCTFLGFQPDGDPSGRTGPLKDEAGTLDGGWWIQGTLHWRQLSVEP